MEIVNCTWKFEFQCPRAWIGLHATEDPNVRICESCLERVHLCRTEEEVDVRSRRGECVALSFVRGPQMLGKLIPRP